MITHDKTVYELEEGQKVTLHDLEDCEDLVIPHPPITKLDETCGMPPHIHKYFGGDTLEIVFAAADGTYHVFHEDGTSFWIHPEWIDQIIN